MPIQQTMQEAIQISKEICKRVLEDVNVEQARFAQIREEQVKLSQEERSKINFLAFAIVGSVLGFSPESLQNPLVVLGLSVILGNAFIFGFIADALQRNLNIKNAESARSDLRKITEPYFDAYDEFGKYLDEPEMKPQVFQQKYDVLQNAYITYLEEHKKQSAKPRIAQKTKLGIGYWYFVLFAAGVVAMGAGLVMQHGDNPRDMQRHHWRQWR